jgi:transposase
MRKIIMVGCDLHAKTLVLRFAVGREKPEALTMANTAAGRVELVKLLLTRAAELNGARVVFAYEASSQGFGLYDQLTEAGIECHVLAPTKIARSPKQKRNKGDGKDATQLLELLRAHVLAGNTLPDVCVPDLQTRDDRELVRARLGGGLVGPLPTGAAGRDGQGLDTAVCGMAARPDLGERRPRGARQLDPAVGVL